MTDNPLLAYYETVHGALIPVRIIHIDGKQIAVVVTGTKSAQGHDIAPFRRGEKIDTLDTRLKSRDVRWRSGRAYTIPAAVDIARSVLPADCVSRESPQEE